jgi:hypothetical protein
LNRLARSALKRHVAKESALKPMFLIKPKYFRYGEGVHLEEVGIPTLGYLANPAYLLSRTDTSEWFDPQLMQTEMRLFADLLQDLMALEPVER